MAEEKLYNKDWFQMTVLGVAALIIVYFMAYAEIIHRAKTEYNNGERYFAQGDYRQALSAALRPYTNLYPLTVIQMLEVGEETGGTSEILQKLADFYEDEVSSATKNLSSVIEPIMMLFIGGAVGFFAISMIQPIYSMTQVL